MTTRFRLGDLVGSSFQHTCEYVDARRGYTVNYVPLGVECARLMFTYLTFSWNFNRHSLLSKATAACSLSFLTSFPTARSAPALGCITWLQLIGVVL